MKNITFMQLYEKLRQIFASTFFYFNQYLTFLIFVLVGCFCYWSLQLFYFPITAVQQQQVIKYSQQSLYPMTQEYTKLLLINGKINRYQYFRFAHLLQTEQQRILYNDSAKK